MLSSAAANLAPSIIRQMSAKKGPDTIDLTLGQPAWGPEKQLLEKALAVYNDGPQGYTPNAGLPELRELIALHHSCLPEQVIVTVGSEQAVYLALSSMLERGDQVLIPEPGYPAYPGICRLLGAEPVSYKLSRENQFVPDLQEISALLTDKSKAILVTSPCNPFGSILSQAKCEELKAFARRNDLVVISDEIYRDIYYGTEAFSTPFDSSCDKSILVSGLSKSCAMTGFRLGYLIGPSEFISQATFVHQLMVTCAPRLSQLMAIEVFKEPSYLTRHLSMYTEARKSLLSMSGQAKLYLGEGAFYAIVDVEEQAMGDSMSLALRLLQEENVAVVPGVAFGSGGDWFWRLSYALGVSTATEGMKRIIQFLARL